MYDRNCWRVILVDVDEIGGRVCNYFPVVVAVL